MSGAIDNAYEIIVRPLPVLSQMEFSKFMQPTQVSRGLSSMGFGISYFIISSGLLFSKKLREKSKEKRLKFLLLIMCSVAVLYTASGINSIIEV
jgi:hypothetical protein